MTRKIFSHFCEKFLGFFEDFRNFFEVFVQKNVRCQLAEKVRFHQYAQSIQQGVSDFRENLQKRNQIFEFLEYIFFVKNTQKSDTEASQVMELWQDIHHRDRINVEKSNARNKKFFCLLERSKSQKLLH